MCVSGEKCLQTIWDDITSEFKDIPYLNLTQDTIWNAARAREMGRPLTPVEDRRIKEGIPRETVVKESFWRMRPGGIAVLPPVGNEAGIFCILEHKRMSDVCDRYLIRDKSTAENQYAPLRGAISTVIQRQGWKVERISFITGARSVDKQDLSKNLKFFRVPEVSINSIYSKLAMRAFDVYANILKCIPKPDNFKRRKKESLCRRLSFFLLLKSSGKAAPGPDPRIRHRIQIGMFRPIRVDHTKCLQVVIKTTTTVVNLKGVCGPLTGDTSKIRIGAKRQIGSRNPWENTKRQVWSTILKREVATVVNIHV